MTTVMIRFSVVHRLFVVVRVSVVHGLFCGERACPALGCGAAPKTATEIYRKKCGVLDGAASHPSAGQARSPQTACSPVITTHIYCGWQDHCDDQVFCGAQSFCGCEVFCGARSFCGERACPALGCGAAPKLPLRFTGRNAVFLMGPLRSPARGKPAHHRAPVHHNKSTHHRTSVHHNNPPTTGHPFTTTNPFTP